MNSLGVLAQKHGTDKAQHGYCPHYERFIGDMRTLPITMIELGVGSGNSLRMWREWMPQAKIYGLDCDGYNGNPTSQGFNVVKGRQENPGDLENLLNESGRFHLVIDDASHNSDDQKVSFSCLFPRLLSDGWYVIEDSFGIGSCFDLDAVAQGNHDIKEFHLIAEAPGDIISFLKKR